MDGKGLKVDATVWGTMIAKENDAFIHETTGRLVNQYVLSSLLFHIAAVQIP